MKNVDKHMRWWMWVLAGVEMICCVGLWLRGSTSVCVPAFAFIAGAVLGFGLRDWRATIDGEIRRLRGS